MFCSECGEKNDKEAKFCKGCGAALNGEKTGATPKNNPTKSFDFQKFFKGFLGHLKSIFTSPISTAKEFIKEENFVTGIIYLGIDILILCIIVLLIIGPLMKAGLAGALSILYLFGGVSTGSNIFSSSYGLGSVDSIQVPYVKIFLYTFLVMAVFYAAMIGFAYLTDRYLLKGKTNIKKTVTWYGYSSLMMSMLFVVTLILGLLDLSKITYLVFISGSIYYSYILYTTYKNTTDTKEDKLGYVFVCSLLASLLVLYVFAQLLQ